MACRMLLFMWSLGPSKVVRSYKPLAFQALIRRLYPLYLVVYELLVLVWDEGGLKRMVNDEETRCRGLNNYQDDGFVVFIHL